MCFPNDYINDEALKITEKIKGTSSFTFVRIESSSEDASIVHKVVLADQAGEEFTVKPNKHGLRFAMGEITHKQYIKLENEETKQAVILFLGIAGSFTGVIFMFKSLFF